ncbi:MAG: ArsR family transcriptional regulator [Halobacteriales archaeon SW_8_66_22]|jgi:DNA-binding IclR family transcriptional regulator|nr:MAG: ArsR family transcriptional regulator [Halobacteriales archaeon SW_10_66_29]PSQ61023.1 MAG: ArsR family transcriptional regulator [Halobacteriales archaeon SW_8_66_22]
MAQSQESESFADGTPLVELFGSPARTKLLSVFVDERDRDLNISELARQAGVARSTVYDHLDRLEELGIIVETRATGPGSRYQLSEESEIAQKLYELDGLVLRRLLELDGELDQQ